ncbi:GlxA family transcriptional regulator [Nocardia inohanensis]|uniref:GlxA family transcriptional regulator n=1 Tax=Nocardia inohanensis TaxID=209246 RepID=UPI0009FC7998
MHTVAVLALDRVNPFDLATPIEVFSRIRLPDGHAGYRVRLCAERPQIDAGLFNLRVPWGLEGLDAADTLVIPGTADPLSPLPPKVREALLAAAEDGARLAAIGSGAFHLAATGLLDGRRATTHWAVAELLAATYPRVEVDPAALRSADGTIFTCAGAAAGLDLCLDLVNRDHGSEVALAAARSSIMPLNREGGQAQFSVAELPSELRRAQQLLETTDDTVERIAARAGFGSPAVFRDRFKRAVGLGPAGYRRAFRRIPVGEGDGVAPDGQ